VHLFYCFHRNRPQLNEALAAGWLNTAAIPTTDLALHDLDEG
jgi:hypothetical protein